MATAELSRQVARRRCLPKGLLRLWLHAYAAVWATTLLPAAVVWLIGGKLAADVRRVFVRHRSPAPHVAHVLVLTAHNIPIVSWPLLLGLWGAHRHPRSTRIADALLLVCVIANAAPVGLELGAYGTVLLPYLPNLPVEWAGMALGASGWLAQRRRALTVREGLAMFALIAVVLLCAAVLETAAVPHR
jgi:hypothetical protein